MSTTEDEQATEPSEEVEAMGAVVEALEALDQPARDRVLRWVIERFLGERIEKKTGRG
jgi:hypothetical protein